MKSYEALNIEVQNDIYIVKINRPKALNALNNQVFEELIQFFTEELLATACKGVIITGEGDRAFAAGADIAEFTSLDDSSARSLSQRGQDIFHKIEHFPRPVIACVNGFALGGGCELAMACHMRLAHAKSKFGQPEVNLGILPGYGGTQRLVQLIGKGKALELMMTGDMIDGVEAYRLGLVNHLCDVTEMIPKAIELINKIAEKAPLAIAETIEVVNAAVNPALNGFEMEVASFGRLAESSDFKEGVAAFLEKRKPNWSGK